MSQYVISIDSPGDRWEEFTNVFAQVLHKRVRESYSQGLDVTSLLFSDEWTESANLARESL